MRRHDPNQAFDSLDTVLGQGILSGIADRRRIYVDPYPCALDVDQGAVGRSVSRVVRVTVVEGIEEILTMSEAV